MSFKRSWITTEERLLDYYNLKLASGIEEKGLRHSVVTIGIKNGIIKKEPCLKCHRKSLVEAHHPEQYQPLNIVWLCKKHHTAIHNWKYLKDWIDKQDVKII